MFVNVSAGFIECRFTNPHCNQLYVDVLYYEKNGRNDAIARITASVDNIYHVFSYQMDLHKKDMKPPLPSSPLAKVMDSTMELEALVPVLHVLAFNACSCTKTNSSLM